MSIATRMSLSGMAALMLSVRGQLILLLLALALPFLVFVSIVTVRESTHERELAGQQMRGFARLTAVRLNDHIVNIEHLLDVISAAVGQDLGDVKANNDLLLRVGRHLPAQINNLSLWNTSGENVGSLEQSLRNPAINASSRGFFRDAIHRPGIAIEAPVPAMSNNKLVGMFAIRIERNSHILGVVMVAARLSELQLLLDPHGSLPTDALVTVTDPTGIVLARSFDPNRWIGSRLVNRASEAGLAGAADGVRFGKSADGVERIAGYATADVVPWQIYVGVPIEVALLSVRTRLNERLYVGAGMFLIGLLVALRIGGRIVAPIRQLAADALAFEHGNLLHRTTASRIEEIDVLATTLNRMAEAIQLRNTELEESQARLKQLSEFDQLTGLPNRRLFLQHLETAIATVTANAPKALLFLDVDNFKAVNDTFGHRKGDEVLCNFSQILNSIVGATGTAARLAGDEFTAIVDCSSSCDIERLASALLLQTHTAISIGNKSVIVSTSIGIVMIRHDKTATELLHCADQALYIAKRAGRNRFEVFRP